MVTVERIGTQPEALRCSCYLANPVIRERHRRLDNDAVKARNGNGERGGRYGSSLGD